MTRDKHALTTTRRGMLGGTLAAGTGLALVGGASEAPAQEINEVDVVIVGAGASGTYAARQLVAAGKTVAVLEADDRPGGRLRRGELNGEPVDMGGMWWGPGQTMLDALSKELGLTRIPMNTKGLNIIDVVGQHYEYEGEMPVLPDEEMANLVEKLTEVETWVSEIDTAAPWSHPRAAEWDSITCDSWMKQNGGTEFTTAFLEFCVKGVCVVEPAQISMLQFLFYCKSGQSLTNLISTAGGAQQELFKGGLFQVPMMMAEQLGDSIHLNSPVRRIDQDESGVTVIADSGTWRAKRVIIAAAPAMAQRIAFEPPLPAMRDVYMQRAPMGAVIKCYLAYETAFWRDKGFTGQAFFEGDANVLFEHNMNGSGKPALVGFMDGNAVLRWAERSPEERRDHVITEVVRLFGEEGAHPIDYTDRAWSADQWRRGGYGTQPVPGTWISSGEAWNAPIGRIHWAGTDSSEIWNGYVEGALHAGKRAADEVLADL